MRADRARQEELEQQRQELAEAVGALREDVKDVTRKAKRVPAALSGLVAVSVLAKGIRAALRRR